MPISRKYSRKQNRSRLSKKSRKQMRSRRSRNSRKINRTQRGGLPGFVTISKYHKLEKDLKTTIRKEEKEKCKKNYEEYYKEYTKTIEMWKEENEKLKKNCSDIEANQYTTPTYIKPKQDNQDTLYEEVNRKSKEAPRRKIGKSPRKLVKEAPVPAPRIPKAAPRIPRRDSVKYATLEFPNSPEKYSPPEQQSDKVKYIIPQPQRQGPYSSA